MRRLPGLEAFKVVLNQLAFVTPWLTTGVRLARAEGVYRHDEYIANELWSGQVHDVFVNDVATRLYRQSFEDSFGKDLVLFISGVRRPVTAICGLTRGPVRYIISPPCSWSTFTVGFPTL